MNLVKINLLALDIISLNYSTRYSYNCRISWDILKHHASRTYLSVIANGNIAKHLRSCTYHHIVAYSRMPLSRLLSRTTKGNSLIKGTIITDYGSLSDYNPYAMVNEKVTSYRCTRVDVYTCLVSPFLHYLSGKKKMSF